MIRQGCGVRIQIKQAVVAEKQSSKEELKEDESRVPLEFMHLSQLRANRRWFSLVSSRNQNQI